MKESLISRVGRIISGSFNSLIDAIENAAPETVMSEAIREIDAAIDDVRVELGRVVASKHLANKRLMEEKVAHANKESQAMITQARKEAEEEAKTILAQAEEETASLKSTASAKMDKAREIIVKQLLG